MTPRRPPDPPDPPDPVTEAADYLYGLPLDEFTAARNDRARQARAAGDRETAQAIGGLAKPSVVAWLANRLVREHRDEITPLLEVGAQLREATASLDAAQLRQLSRQQQQVVRALVRQARALAGAAGQAFTDATERGLESTLHAALADEEAARELATARLTTGLSRPGFPGAGAFGAPSAVPSAAPAVAAGGRQPGTRVSRDEEASVRADRLARARQDEQQARDRAEQAGQAQEEARAEQARAEQEARDAVQAVQRLRSELDDAERTRTEASRAERQARKDAELADRAARAAQRRLADAAARVRELSG